MQPTATPPRVIHFVTGGFSGATQVAVNLCLAAQRAGSMQTMLVLRRKVTTDLRRVQALRDQGLQVALVPGWTHWLTRWALRRLCRDWRADIMVAHGFPEHLIGREAAAAAGVPSMIHVEHNTRERYTWWRLHRARRLADRTARLVGVSEGVRQYLVSLGFRSEQTLAIPNGIDLQRFANADVHPYAQRESGIVMAARFASQKDHLTLIRAAQILKQRYQQRPKIYLAGTGKAIHRQRAEREVHDLGLSDQVVFVGHHSDLPGFLMTKKICVLSTHFEGMPLALIEGMAAGCAVVASDVPGVKELVRHGEDGLLVPPSSPEALAEALAGLLSDPAKAAALAANARRRAQADFGMDLMLARYEQLLLATASRRIG
jgi:glycosyltransferase involved in cell wall biosynthesis